MALVNVIRGDRIDGAPINVRTPLSASPCGWPCPGGRSRASPGSSPWRSAFWYITCPAAFFGWLYLEWGWTGPVGFLGGLVAILGGWAAAHRASFLRLPGSGPRPGAGMVLPAQLARRHGNRQTRRLVRLPHRPTGPAQGPLRRRGRRGDRPHGHRADPRRLRQSSERFAHTFGVRQVKADPGRALIWCC